VLGAREEGAWWLRAEEMASSMRRFLNPLVLNIQKMELELTCPVWYRTSPPPPRSSPTPAYSLWI
jgi:hypothetical protein